MKFERPLLIHLVKRLQEPRRFIQVIYGPRQVGKTTLAGQLLGKLAKPNLFISADAVAAAGDIWISQQWESARLLCRKAETEEFILVIDEIQKITNWSEIVKRMWDEDSRLNTPIKVILLGSSRLLLQQGLTESLTGRYETTYLGHWSLNEMQEAFDVTVDQYIWYGGYPGAAGLTDDEVRWRRYVNDSLIEPSISKDILMLTRVDKPALLRKLFELGCAFSGQILSFNKILGQLLDAGNTTTLAHYLELLNAAGLLTGLEKFSGDEIRKRSSSPKFQVHNTALMTALQDLSFSEVTAQPEKWGRWVESAVGSHLVNHKYEGNLKLFYWRQANDEVDFVLQRKSRFVGIEIKSGKMNHTSGMSTFNKKYRPDKFFLIGKDGIPVTEFLRTNPAELF